SGKLVADDPVRRGVAEGGIESEAVDDRGLAGAAAVALVGGHPAGEQGGQLRDVPLAVAAVDAEGVQFHDLTGVVLVDSACETLVLIEVAEHCRAGGAGGEEVDEGACAPPHDAREGEVFVPLAAGFALANPGGEMVLGPEAEAVARGGGGVEGLLHGATGNVI